MKTMLPENQAKPDFASLRFHKSGRLLTFSFVYLVISWSATCFAHSPVFMMAPEAPGKGAFDVHTSLTHASRGSERQTSAGLELTYGVSRDLAVGFEVPFAREERFGGGGGQATNEGVDNPEFFLQWRFWDNDTLGAKHSSALRLGSTAPVGDKSVAWNKPTFMLGWAYGMESLKWYYTLDTRYQYNIEDNNGKPGDRFFADAAIGLRPRLAGLEDTDIVYFMELNYLNEQSSKTNGVDNPDSGGDFLFISPEILISPSNRMMIRTGAQIPVYQQLNGAQAPKDITYKLVLELRY